VLSEGNQGTLQVVTDQLHRPIGQQRSQLLDTGSGIHRVGCRQPLVPHGQINGLARLDSQADADDIGAHRLRVIRLQRQGQLSRGAGVRQKGGEIVAVREPAVLAYRAFRFVGVLVHQAAKFQFDEQVVDAGTIGFGGAQVLDGHRQFQFRVDGCQVFGQQRLVGVLGQVAAVLKTGQVGGVLDGGLDRAIGLDQCAGALGSDARYAGYVVHAVAHQPEQVGHLARQYAELLLDGRGVVDERLVAIATQPHMLVDQLQEILVLGDDHRSDARGGGVLGERADDVVRFVALQLHHRDAHGLDDLAHPGQLRAQIVGHRRAVRLVLLVLLVSDRLSAGVEHHRDVVGMLLVEEFAQHGGEAVGCVRRNARGRGEFR